MVAHEIKNKKINTLKKHSFGKTKAANYESNQSTVHPTWTEVDVLVKGMTITVHALLCSSPLRLVEKAFAHNIPVQSCGFIPLIRDSLLPRNCAPSHQTRAARAHVHAQLKDFGASASS